MNIKDKIEKYYSLNWSSIIVVTIIVIYVYFFMEWIFLVTKPSFMSSLNRLDQFGIFFQSASFISVIYLVFIGILILIGLKLHTNFKRAMILMGIFIPSFLTACLILLLVDNFSYTIFQFGIVTSTGLVRAFYSLFFLFLLVLSIKELSSITTKISKFLFNFGNKKEFIFSLPLMIILVLFGIIPVVKSTLSPNFSSSLSPLKNSPHIFLITADGVNAENMSLYGYERETTPFLELMANESLVAQNAFTNSANTSGSIISIFTGKYPIDTQVLYPPDILKSEDAYQHLPAILKLNGYTTNQLSYGHYVDAYQLNVLNGFDEANGRSYQSSILGKINQYLPDNLSFFLYEISNRIFDRIRHIFFIKQMSNPFKEVSSPDNYQDIDKLDSVINLIENSNKPIFSHIHWMGTHGARFYPSEQVYSADKEPEYQNDWEENFYDDSILDFDRAMEIFYLELENRGLLDKSIIIITSDHGQRFTTDKRLPFIIRFPNSDFQKKIESNVQNLDIAPTILDYLDISKPEWMVGDSLLKEISNNRPIFAVGVGNVERDEKGNIIPELMEPPFYQFGFVSVIYCDSYFRLELSDFSFHENKILGYVGDCTGKRIERTQVLEEIIQFFNTYDYDTSSLLRLLD